MGSLIGQRTLSCRPADRRPGLGLAAALWLVLAAAPADAQELEPRAYSPNPVGANFIVQSYVYQSGDVMFDPSLPFSDVEARISAAVAGYGCTFDLFGRTASFLVMMPYVWGDVEGNVGEEYRAITRSGLGDLRTKFTVNVFGGPALKPREFAARTPGTMLGVSALLSVPAGQYDPAKLINIGTNRWAFKPELGLTHPIGNWTLEAFTGVWFFGDNDNFYGGKLRSQDPLLTFQAHVGYNFRPRLWLAGDFTYYSGGVVYSDEIPTDTRQSNSRAGLTVSLPFHKRHSIKVSVARGVTARVGSDFTTIGVAYQYFWFAKY